MGFPNGFHGDIPQDIPSTNVKPLEARESSSSTPDFVGHSDVPAVSRPDKGATMESQWRNGMKGDEKISDLSGE